MELVAHQGKIIYARSTNRTEAENNQTYYGHNNYHIKGDPISKIIVKYEVTEASVHDRVAYHSQALENLLEDTDGGQAFYADSAHSGETQNNTITNKKKVNLVYRKGHKKKSLLELEKEYNREKSKKRSRVEHIFGTADRSMESSMNGIYFFNIGQKSIAGVFGLMN